MSIHSVRSAIGDWVAHTALENVACRGSGGVLAASSLDKAHSGQGQVTEWHRIGWRAAPISQRNQVGEINAREVSNALGHHLLHHMRRICIVRARLLLGDGEGNKPYMFCRAVIMQAGGTPSSSCQGPSGRDVERSAFATDKIRFGTTEGIEPLAQTSGVVGSTSVGAARHGRSIQAEFASQCCSPQAEGLQKASVWTAQRRYPRRFPKRAALARQYPLRLPAPDECSLAWHHARCVLQ